jgi:hypothetical protein
VTKNEKIREALLDAVDYVECSRGDCVEAEEDALGRWKAALALPEDEPAPGGQEERRKWFLLGMAEAEAVVRKQRVDGMTPIDPAKARQAAEMCALSVEARRGPAPSAQGEVKIECPRCLHDFTLPATGERERGFREGIEAAAKVADSGTKSGTSYAPYARRLATSIRAVRAPAPSAPTTAPEDEC